MKKIYLFILVSAISLSVNAQSYIDSIYKFRKEYKDDFLTDNHSPLTAADTSFLRFFAPNEAYCVTATFTLTPEGQPFDIPTYNEKKKNYRNYGTVTFKLRHSLQTLTLHIYQSLELIKDPKYKDYLFIPFTDETNYKETYGGGRYLDLTIQDIKGDKVVLDFNKAYNPYCAYASGYSCPIPPSENSLHVSIKAGEKQYGKKVE
jgi:uncharacterized protein (DUF1684 family)